MPRLISGWPKRAVSAAMRIVHAIASSQPPPSAKPLIAAITGLPSCSIASKICWPRRACSLPSTGVCTASSLMSAPATNDFSPAPVSTIARTPASALNAGDRGRQFVQRLGVQRVQDFRAVEGDDGDGIVALDQEVFKGHSLNSLPHAHAANRPRERADHVVADVAPFGESRGHEHLLDFDGQRRARWRSASASASARRVTPRPAAAGGRAQRQQRQARVAAHVQHGVGESRRPAPGPCSGSAAP